MSTFLKRILLPLLVLGLAAAPISAGCSTSGGGDDDGGGSGSDDDDDDDDGNSDDDDDDGNDDDDDGDDDDGNDDDGNDDDGGEDCNAGCQDLGFATGEPDGDTCVCDEPTDAGCANGVSGYCACNEAAGAPCDEEEFFNAYVACVQDDEGAREQLLCVNDYIDGDVVDCDGAAACFPE